MSDKDERPAPRLPAPNKPEPVGSYAGVLAVVLVGLLVLTLLALQVQP